MNRALRELLVIRNFKFLLSVQGIYLQLGELEAELVLEFHKLLLVMSTRSVHQMSVLFLNKVISALSTLSTHLSSADDVQ